MKTTKLAMFAAVTVAALSFNLAPAFAQNSSTTVDTGKQESGFKRGPGGPGGKCGPGGKSFHGGKRFHRGGGGGFVKALGITTDQLEKMNTLKLDFKASTEPKKAELKVLSSELKDGMTKPGVSKSQLLNLQSKINEIKAALSTTRVGYMADRMAVLTDDQKSKIREFSLKRQAMGGKHHKGFKRGFGHKRGFGGPRVSDAPAAAPVDVTASAIES